MRQEMKKCSWRLLLISAAPFLVAVASAYGQDSGKEATSYAPVAVKESFDTIKSRMIGEKSAIMKRQMELLNECYDLGDRPAKDMSMSRGKAVREGVRIRLFKGMTWEKLLGISIVGDNEWEELKAGTESVWGELRAILHDSIVKIV